MNKPFSHSDRSYNTSNVFDKTTDDGFKISVGEYNFTVGNHAVLSEIIQ